MSTQRDVVLELFTNAHLLDYKQNTNKNAIFVNSSVTVHSILHDEIFIECSNEVLKDIISKCVNLKHTTWISE